MAIKEECIGGNDDDNTKKLKSDEEAGFDSDSTIDPNNSISSMDEIVEDIQIGLFHYLILISCGLCFAGYSIYYQAIGFIIISACDLDINTSNRGWLSMSLVIGFALGVGVLGRMADIYGRRRILLFSLTINVISMLASAFAFNYNMLVVMASIIGCSHGGLAVSVHTYVVEFFPRRYRGIAAGSMIGFLILGSLFSSTIALLILPHPFYKRMGNIYFSSWRLYLLINIIPMLIGYCIMPCMPDSIRFALEKSERKTVGLVLDKINRINSCCQNDKIFPKQYTMPLIPISDHLDDQNKMAVKNGLQNEIGHFQLFLKPPYLQRFLLLSIGWFGFCFSDQGFTIWLPTVVSYYTSGKVCRHSHHQIHNVSQKAMHDLGFDSFHCQVGENLKKVIMDILFGNLFSIPIAIMCLLLVNRIGRKWLYWPMITFCGFCILLILLIDNELSALILGSLFTSISNNTWIPYKTWSSELFPTKVRSTAIGIFNVIGHTGSILAMITFSLLFHKNCTATLIIFSSLGLLTGLAGLFLPDTTNADID
ncbi:uncharacterized protein TRIADDRAFT_31308 [Trichoplax adhaerens]|uniref:Major facilitator superfamily (MFS) profile domain-containing protein n=1 Tax=Trichoplax adhaerens TaxID=10228 RepID=B3S937_TRIAD|nr:hypothetical protein TRIADDRAFT_31308 [Trichoplax adhaerens]EDV20803.1 hypothetical protein TRIADDRAFT_31308 [Trichoplax adhaerens]|eukprot:XP_002116744.1 hypothetical protein TRIADDRAFT_31308 [Trichoplax adhaerens]